jgi:hypothetical protein
LLPDGTVKEGIFENNVFKAGKTNDYKTKPLAKEEARPKNEDLEDVAEKF